MTKYPATRRQTNKAGLTALQIAQKLKFTRIAALIETGRAVPVSSDGQEGKADEVKHDYHTLVEACRQGRIKVMEEFIEQRYESKEEKRRLCYELIQIAKKAQQLEIVALLEPYYDTKLKTERPSDMEEGSVVRLNEHYKKVLLASLSGLSSLIADSPVILDPADPNTYRDLFSALTAGTAKRSQEVQQVTSEQDVKRLIDHDEMNTKEQLVKINEQLENLMENRTSLQARIQEVDKRLFKGQDLAALQRKEFFKEKELHKQQLAVYECSVFLIQRRQEATLNRQKTIQFIKGNTNLAMFYRTVESRLEILFNSLLVAQSGYLKTEASARLGTAVNTLATKISMRKYSYLVRAVSIDGFYS